MLKLSSISVAGFYFRDSTREIWKKGIKFRDSSVLNFILFFKRLNVLKFVDNWNKQNASSDLDEDDG